jgi:hypothetical protein
LPDVIPDQGNTRVDLNEIRWVGHELSLSLIWIALRPGDPISKSSPDNRC